MHTALQVAMRDFAEATPTSLPEEGRVDATGFKFQEVAAWCVPIQAPEAPDPEPEEEDVAAVAKIYNEENLKADCRFAKFLFRLGTENLGMPWSVGEVAENLGQFGIVFSPFWELGFVGFHTGY